MATLEDSPRATGAPGIEPRWTHSAKDVVGTAYSTASPIWFTASGGVLSEVYFPTIDRPQIRDLQYLVTDGETFFHDAHRDQETSVEYLDEIGLGARIVNSDRSGRYRLIMDVITDPHQPCLLLDTWLDGDPDLLPRLRLFVLLSPHLNVGGWGNSANVARMAGYEFLTAHKDSTWLAMSASVPFVRRSCGYVGRTDGWQDLSQNFELDWQFASAPDGNVALTAEIELPEDRRFTLGVGFGNSMHRAVTCLYQALGVPFAQHSTRFTEQWKRACSHMYPLERWTGDDGHLCRRSRELLLAHEDKRFPGALIASLSIPWGEVKGDEDLGGYHLVWTRDMVNSATGLLAAGDAATPLRALIYLACSQHPDGGFPQNFWIDGTPYWQGIQLDEVAFPIMLAYRMVRAGATMGAFDPYPMVLAAARYLIHEGPITPQERWEENSGYSPSTLASNIAALICAAYLADERGDAGTAQFLLGYADFLESHVERWTVTDSGFLVPGIKRHYVRINPGGPGDATCDEGPDGKIVPVRNCAPGAPYQFQAAEIVDAGFLELVRYGIRRPRDPLIEDSLRVIDATLKTDLPGGPCWRRYTHDGYGQRDDGGPFVNWGVGRPWPLLTGERGHYELAAGRDVTPYLRAMENFATHTRLLPEQVWDRPDIPEALMRYGRPTGAAMPLMWAHAEYMKLLRSAADGVIFDLIPEVAARYRVDRPRPQIEVWKHNRQIASVTVPCTLRIQWRDPFMLHWTKDEWHHVHDSHSTHTAVGLYFVDIEVTAADRAPVRFTFYWENEEKWEGRDHAVELREP
ncbi:MAG TPA: glycoside hydrolase family 15 protein [Candidatus Binataceae bacterium]|nr:glycoside hydrolase family 15 protein [Candidatus Binataceae bacterium]